MPPPVCTSFCCRGSLLDVGLLLGVVSLLGVGSSMGMWCSSQRMAMNDNFQSLFVIWLPCPWHQCGSCQRGMEWGDSPPLVVATWWVVMALQSLCWWEGWRCAWMCFRWWWLRGRLWVEGLDKFPFTEFAGIAFRKVVVGWYVGHKYFTGNKAFMV